jgi:hypothetical protein
MTSHWTLRIHPELIMLLVYGDLTRATAYFLFAVVSQARGTVRTEAAVCQSSGFLIQYGTETSGESTLEVIQCVHSINRPRLCRSCNCYALCLAGFPPSDTRHIGRTLPISLLYLHWRLPHTEPDGWPSFCPFRASLIDPREQSARCRYVPSGIDWR